LSKISDIEGWLSSQEFLFGFVKVAFEFVVKVKAELE
jgi:hypothetical protein